MQEQAKIWERKTAINLLQQLHATVSSANSRQSEEGLSSDITEHFILLQGKVIKWIFIYIF